MDNKKVGIVLGFLAVIIILVIVLLSLFKSPEVYTVTFDLGNNLVGETKEVEKNGLVTKPVDPTKEGYKFAGWYLDGKVFDFDTIITRNITLTAKWEKEANNEVSKPEKPVTVTYTVSFDSNGGSTVKSQTVTKDSTAKKPTVPTRDGYTFLGWYNGTKVFDFSTKITSNITLTAKWEKDVEEVKVSYKIVDVENSLVNQAKLYIIANGVKVKGTIDVTSKSGKTVTKTVDSTGLDIVKGTYTYSNPKVLD